MGPSKIDHYLRSIFLAENSKDLDKISLEIESDIKANSWVTSLFYNNGVETLIMYVIVLLLGLIFPLVWIGIAFYIFIMRKKYKEVFKNISKKYIELEFNLETDDNLFYEKWSREFNALSLGEVNNYLEWVKKGTYKGDEYKYNFYLFDYRFTLVDIDRRRTDKSMRGIVIDKSFTEGLSINFKNEDYMEKWDTASDEFDKYFDAYMMEDMGAAKLLEPANLMGFLKLKEIFKDQYDPEYFKNADSFWSNFTSYLRTTTSKDLDEKFPFYVYFGESKIFVLFRDVNFFKKEKDFSMKKMKNIKKDSNEVVDRLNKILKIFHDILTQTDSNFKN